MIRFFLLVSLVLLVSFLVNGQSGVTGNSADVKEKTDKNVFTANNYSEFLIVTDRIEGSVQSKKVAPLSFPLCRTRTTLRLVIKGERINAGDVAISKSFTVLALIVEL